MKTTIKLLNTLVLIFIGTTASIAQTKAPVKVSGSLLDENDRSMPFSTVSLLRAADSTVVMGTVSNETGQYIFDHISSGSYIVKATVVGYKTITTEAFELKPGATEMILPSLKMTPTSFSLNTVNVTAAKPLVEHNGDKTTINVEGSVLSAGNSAMDILERAPGVIIDKDGNISLNGRQGVAVMINDKLTYLTPVELATLLRSSDGNTIKSIEITTNPSAKYDATGNAGIINIRLKKSNQSGTNASIVTGVGYGKDDETISMSHK